MYLFDIIETLTACQRKTQEAHDKAPLIDGKKLIPPGAFVPTCKENGEFEETQCHGSTGYCWCVDKLGTKMEDTSRRFEKPECKRSKIFINFYSTRFNPML